MLTCSNQRSDTYRKQDFTIHKPLTMAVVSRVSPDFECQGPLLLNLPTLITSQALYGFTGDGGVHSWELTKQLDYLMVCAKLRVALQHLAAGVSKN